MGLSETDKLIEKSLSRLTRTPSLSPKNERRLNPLNVDLVVMKMLSYLDLNELKAAREVSRRWNVIATQFFYPFCSKVELSFNDDNYWTNAKNYGIEEMKDFVRLVEMSGECPFSKFDIGTSIIKGAHEGIVSDFFHVCGQYMEQLTVRDDWGKRFFRRGIPEKMEFNYLKKLKIHLLQASVDTLELFFEFITSIMKASPYLEHVALVSHNGFDQGETVECLIKALVECGCEIKTLEIEAQMQDVHLISLSTMGLKLTHLSVDFWGSQFADSSAMKAFLASQSLSLESFKLADVAMSSLCVIEFPCMKELRTLKIKGSMLGRISVSFPHISFVDQFPNLKTLSFSDLFGEWDEFLKTGLKPSLTIEELKLPCDFVDSLCLQRAAYLFPRLKKLEVPHYQHLIDVVYELMPNLEELTINTRYISLVDDIITGIPHELCTAINKDSCYARILMNNELQEYQTSKSITSLTKLKTLRLKCKRKSDPVEITDISCYLALFQMRSLECLDFGLRPIMLSRECLQEMQDRFEVISLNLQEPST